MQVAEYNYEDFEASKQNEADKTLLVKFYYHAIPDRAKSDEEGRPMFKEVEMIDIKVPGQRDGVARPATHRDKGRFPQHYQAFLSRTEAPTEGTPLIEWPAVTRSFAEQLSFINIKTVEQLADLNDNTMHQVPGIANFKQKAKDWLEATKDDGILSRLRTELEERDTKIEEMSGQMDALISRLDALEAKPTRKKR